MPCYLLGTTRAVVRLAPSRGLQQRVQSAAVLGSPDNGDDAVDDGEQPEHGYQCEAPDERILQQQHREGDLEHAEEHGAPRARRPLQAVDDVEDAANDGPDHQHPEEESHGENGAHDGIGQDERAGKEGDDAASESPAPLRGPVHQRENGVEDAFDQPVHAHDHDEGEGRNPREDKSRIPRMIAQNPNARGSHQSHESGGRTACRCFRAIVYCLSRSLTARPGTGERGAEPQQPRLPRGVAPGMSAPCLDRGKVGRRPGAQPEPLPG